MKGKIITLYYDFMLYSILHNQLEMFEKHVWQPFGKKDVSQNHFEVVIEITKRDKDIKNIIGLSFVISAFDKIPSLRWAPGFSNSRLSRSVSRISLQLKSCNHIITEE